MMIWVPAWILAALGGAIAGLALGFGIACVITRWALQGFRLR